MPILRFGASRYTTLLSTLCLALVGCSSAGQSTSGADVRPVNSAAPDVIISYAVALDTVREDFLVSATFENVERDTLVYHLPIWGPGAYDIVNFGSYVYDFTAVSSTGRNLVVLRGDTNTFRIIGGDHRVRLAYRVSDVGNIGNSPWFGLSDVDSGLAFANSVAVFGYLQGYKDVPVTVRYEAPRGWELAVALEPENEKQGLYTAADYDELVDAPFQMGHFQKVEFSIDGVPHVITVTAPRPATAKELAELKTNTEKIVRMLSGFFGDIPYKRYLFQHYFVEPGVGDFSFGALEHRNSSTYRMPVSALVQQQQLNPVIAHEYWHLWSPKRIHVSELGPFDYQRAPNTASLWFAEGLTEYYAQVLLARNGMKSHRGLLNTVNTIMRSGYGRTQGESLTSLSRRIASASMFEMVAVYSKGPVLVLLLDAEIRRQTNNAKSLDDAMIYFNNEFGKTGKTFSDEEIIPAIERATGARLQQFYDRYIDGTEPFPYAELLPVVGLKIVEKEKKEDMFAAELAKVASPVEGYRVVSVTDGGSADASGLRAGDVITSFSFAHQSVPVDQIPLQVLEEYPMSRQLNDVTLHRDGKDITLPIKRVKSVRIDRNVEIDRSARGQALDIRNSIFGKVK